MKIKSNTNSNNAVREPMLLLPCGKNYFWGGERLKSDYGKNFFGFTPLAETWECSVHPEALTSIANGPYKGQYLSDILMKYPDFIGREKMENVARSLPFIIKFIDAKQNLSVQVHPDDSYANRHEGQSGKTEVWYVLEADPGAKLIYGFSHKVNRRIIENAIRDGTLPKHLQYLEVHKGDVFFVESGLVHSIGAGMVVAEIQESSNITYRIFDYDRKDENGKKRVLQIEKALDVLNYDYTDEVRQRMRYFRYTPGTAIESISRCQYFQVDRVLNQGIYDFDVTSKSCHVVICIDGSGIIRSRKNTLKVQNIKKGDCYFIPADCGKIEIGGQCELLKVNV